MAETFSDRTQKQFAENEEMYRRVFHDSRRDTGTFQQHDFRRRVDKKGV